VSNNQRIIRYVSNPPGNIYYWHRDRSFPLVTNSWDPLIDNSYWSGDNAIDEIEDIKVAA